MFDRTLLIFEGKEYVARVIAMEGEGEDDEDGVDIPDTRRGVFEADSHIYMREDEIFKHVLKITGAMSRSDTPPPKNSVSIHTNDEECFPVRSKLLQPCIKLTSAVMAGHGVHVDALPEVKVDVDCLTLDRILRFLEASAKGKEFTFDLEYNDAMLEAAKRLGCMPLEYLCLEQQGEFQQRVRPEGLRWAEITERNNNGEVSLTALRNMFPQFTHCTAYGCMHMHLKYDEINPAQMHLPRQVLIIIDGMVFDVTRWLPEHPGGNSIIPTQALNVDGTVWFETYHASRKSFLYLEQFYIGDLVHEDLSEVPPAHSGLKEPSQAFLDQLHDFTQWRVAPKEARAHMGQAK